MPTSDVVSISISVSGAGPSREGFGEPLIAAYNLPFSDIVREYSSVAGMVADGFAVTHPAYLAASAVFAQSPSPTAVKVAKRGLAHTQTLKVTCNSTVTSDVYSIQVRTPGGSWHLVTTPSTGVVATDAATLASAISALSLTGVASCTQTGSNAYFTITMTPGKLLDVQPDLLHCSFADITADPGIATDLAAILAVDGDWYGLVLDSQSPAEITAAAAWVESNGKLFIWNSTDTECMDPSSTTDVMYTEKSLNHTRSAGLMSASQLLSYSGAAWQGRMFPTDAGSEDWAFKTLSGIITDPLTTTQSHAVENKNASVYTPLLGLSLTQFSRRPDGEWIDITRGVDALQNDMTVGVVALLANNTKKVPMTDPGIDQVRSVFMTSLAKFVNVGFLAATPAPFVSVPTAASVGSTDRAARNLPRVGFTAQLAGAINSVTVQGVLSS